MRTFLTAMNLAALTLNLILFVALMHWWNLAAAIVSGVVVVLYALTPE